METPSIPDAQPRPKRWRKILRRFSTAFGLLLLAGVLWLFLSPDEPPPDVSDFTVTPLKLPDDQNAFALIRKATALVKPDSFYFADDADGSKFNDMVNGKTWDAALARQWLDGTDMIWPLWEQAAQASQTEAPVGTDIPSFIPEISPINRVAKLAQIRAWDLARSGKLDAAIESLLTCLQVALHIQRSKGPVISYLTGAAIKRQAMDSLRGITTGLKPSASILRQTLQHLETTRPDKDLFAHALRGEYRYVSFLVDHLAAELARTPDSGWSLANKIAVRVPLLFKPNRTLRIYAESIRKEIGEIDREDWSLDHWQTAEFSEIARSGVHFYSPDNIVGRWLLTVRIPSDEELLKVRLKEQTAISANEAFLALVLYYREHGELPATLDALVPAYLPTVPRDYLDGRPIRYSRELRAVWSVGLHNFKPVGLDPDDSVRKEQIYLSLDFAPPSAEAKLAPAAAAPP